MPPGLVAWAFAAILAVLPAGEHAFAGAPTSSDVEGAKVAVFGFVRDSKGAAVTGAVVTADFTTMKIKIVGRSDATGAYAIYKLGDDDAAAFATVTCVKDGFRFVKEIPRHIVAQAGQPAEIDCVMDRK